MPLRMVDWQCSRCKRQWELLTNLTSDGQAASPRCPWGCAAFAVRIYKAPAIRTNDNYPRDLRQFTTGGHPVQGTTLKNGKWVDSQLGVGFESRAEHEKYLSDNGLVPVTAQEYAQKHLSYEPPTPRLEDDPKELQKSIEDSCDMFDRWEAGKLPELETPMLDQDAEAREHVERLTTTSAEATIAQAPGDELDG